MVQIGNNDLVCWDLQKPSVANSEVYFWGITDHNFQCRRYHFGYGVNRTLHWISIKCKIQLNLLFEIFQKTAQQFFEFVKKDSICGIQKTSFSNIITIKYIQLFVCSRYCIHSHFLRQFLSKNDMVLLPHGLTSLNFCLKMTWFYCPMHLLAWRLRATFLFPYMNKKVTN